jgi:hypothetical protein
MATFLFVLFVSLRSILRSRVDLQLENLALRHQIGVLQRSVKKRPKLSSNRSHFLGCSIPPLARLALDVGSRQAGNGCGLAS